MLDRWYHQLTTLSLKHLSLVAVAFAATLLTLYGPDLTKLLKRRTRKWPLLARAALFIGVVGVGFGALVLALTPLLRRYLLLLGPKGVIPMILVTIVALGILAERRKQI